MGVEAMAILRAALHRAAHRIENIGAMLAQFLSLIHI